MVLHAWGVADFGIKVYQRFPVGKKERSVGVHLAPDEHVLGGQRDQFVALPHVGTHGIHDRALGISICGFKSGTQNWHLRSHPVVNSTTPNVVRLSGNRMASRVVG